MVWGGITLSGVWYGLVLIAAKHNCVVNRIIRVLCDMVLYNCIVLCNCRLSVLYCALCCVVLCCVVLFCFTLIFFCVLLCHLCCAVISYRMVLSCTVSCCGVV